MNTWTMAQAKRDFSIGYLTDFSMTRYELGHGWRVDLRGGSARGSLVDARDKSPRQFRTLDAAVSALEQIGFKVEGLCKA